MPCTTIKKASAYPRPLDSTAFNSSPLFLALIYNFALHFKACFDLEILLTQGCLRAAVTVTNVNQCVPRAETCLQGPQPTN